MDICIWSVIKEGTTGFPLVFNSMLKNWVTTFYFSSERMGIEKSWVLPNTAIVLVILAIFAKMFAKDVKKFIFIYFSEVTIFILFCYLVNIWAVYKIWTEK